MGLSCMEDDLTRVERYNERAKKLRALAKDEIIPKTRATLLKIANEYERLYSKAIAKLSNGPK